MLENKKNSNINVILCIVLGKCLERLQRAFELWVQKRMSWEKHGIQGARITVMRKSRHAESECLV